MKRALALALFVVVCFFLITLEMKNPDSVLVQYYFGIEYSLPLFILVVIPFLAGLFFGVLFMSMSLFKHKRTLGKTKKDLLKAEQEVQNLRAAPIKDEVQRLSWFNGINWTWPALMLAFLCGVQLTRFVTARRQNRNNRAISEDYFKGLNYLLNEEPDKAIEVFIKAIEVDSETVELHLALGGLFRRKGQVDRATRIHQNLIARPDLSDEHRLQAIYELAQDYDHAGLLDRAENLYKELMESSSYRKRAIEGLEKIYRHEKEWRSAIDVILLHKRQDKPELNESLAQYWCELADEAIMAGQYANADKALRNAASVNKDSPRTLLLKGDLAFALDDYAVASRVWRGMAEKHPSLIDLVVEKIIRAYRLCDNQTSLEKFLMSIKSLPKAQSGFAAWYKACVNAFGIDGAYELLVELMSQDGITSAAAEQILEEGKSKRLKGAVQEKTLTVLLEKEKRGNLQYTCGVCGYSVKSILWHCPNCNHWESFR